MKLTVKRRQKDLLITLRVPWKRRRRVVSAETGRRISAGLLAHHKAKSAEAPESA